MHTRNYTMKNHYSLLALTLPVFLVPFILAFTANAQTESDLQFNENGKFKILQFTDTHIDLSNESNLNVYQIMQTILEREKPDFAVLTGDLITQSEPQEGYRRFADVFQKAKVPWAAVFGNHDAQGSVSREYLAEFLPGLPYCLNGDLVKDEVYGYSNFVLPVYGRNGNIQALLYCLYSNTCSTLKPSVEGDGWFEFSQISWYRNTSKEYTRTNGGKPLPALAFFHIPLPEYTQAWKNRKAPPIGVKNESECCPDINTGMFAAMLEAGDVMGTFVGHDHINDYIGVHCNIALAYGRVTKVMRDPEEDPLAGGRVIVLTEGQRKFDTWIRDMNGKRELACTWPDSFTSANKKK